MSYDRTVHGWTADLAEIVRYDRAGKWYVEYPPATLKPRRPVSVAEAVRLATEAGARVFANRYGGQAFNARVRALSRKSGDVS